MQTSKQKMQTITSYCSRIMSIIIYVNISSLKIIIIIIIQHLYSAMKSGDTEALGGARLRRVETKSL